MSNWKRLAQNSFSHNSSYSNSKQPKYTPKRMRGDEQNSTRFHNHTIDRMSQSGVSQQKEKLKDRSFLQKNTQIQQPRILKANLSQVRLPRQLLNQPRNSVIMTSGSVIMNIPDYPDPKIKNLPYNYKKSDKNLLFEQIQKLKKQFNTFQIIIFNQLKKKQKQIIQMLQNILDKIKQVKYLKKNNTVVLNFNSTLNPNHSNKQLTNTNNNTNKQQLQPLILTPSPSQKLYPLYKKNPSENDLLGNKLSLQINKILQVIHKPYKQLHLNLCNDNQENQHKFSTFDKFFSAVENLKKDIKDLNQISDVSSIKSPKSQLSKYTNQNWLSFSNTQH